MEVNLMLKNKNNPHSLAADILKLLHDITVLSM